MVSHASVRVDRGRGQIAVVLLALLGCGLSMAPIPLYIASRLATRPLLHEDEPMWPFPGVIFLEVVASGLVGLIAVLRGSRTNLLWVAAGILFSVGALTFTSIGILVLPGAVLFAVASIVNSRTRRSRLREDVAARV